MSAAEQQRPPPAAQPDPGAGNKSAVRQYEQELEQKERAIRESIAAKISRIHEVERQLAALHNQLHVNVAPRKQALELLRHKIEEENRQIDVHRAAFSRAKAAMEAATAALAAAEQRKSKLSEELTMLVMQSSGAQMRKLEQLSEELEHLTTGLPTAAASAANGSGHAAAGGSVAPAAAGADARVQVQVAAAAAGQQQQQQQDAKSGASQPAAAAGLSATDSSAAAEQQAQEEARRSKLEQQRQAAAARGRHVQLGGRRAGGSSGSNGSPAAAPTRIPQPPVPRTSSAGGSGRFEGFE